MKTLFKIVILLLILGAIAAAGYRPAGEYLKRRNQPKWRCEEVTRGRIAFVVNATGTVKPVLSVRVGAVVSGPIVKLYKDFNDEVKEKELLAQIDPLLYKAAVARDEAMLATRVAEQRRAEAQLEQTKADHRRAVALFEENPDFISGAELDQLKYSVAALTAARDVAIAAVQQAEASLKNSQVNLEYTEIKSPVDGIIIDRKIDEGQALAAAFQTPELFIVAPDLRKKMHIYANVDETDIGLIQQAQRLGQPVQFTVDAHPEELFTGVIEEIRLASKETQNVVTYPVVLAAPNPDLKLLPGMTAGISFRIDERQDVLRIPNTALRYFPEEKYVRPEDRELLRGETGKKEDPGDPHVILSAEEKAELRRKRSRRHVWVVDREQLRAVEVTIGLADSKSSELVSGDLAEGQSLVTGVDPK
jgi:HlyD family secretion protein